MSFLLLLHVSAATVALLSGGMAMIFRKGAGIHRLAGNLFCLSMVVMTTTAAYMASVRGVMINVVAASLTFYLVATGWLAARRREKTTGIADWVWLLMALAVAGGAYLCGVNTLNGRGGPTAGVPVQVYFIFGTVALLFAAGDVRMLVRGGVAGGQRIARHLTRTCFAMLIATLSFYPGQAKLFSRALRQTNLLFIPLILVIGSTLFWMVRVRSTNRFKTT